MNGILCNICSSDPGLYRECSDLYCARYDNSRCTRSTRHQLIKTLNTSCSSILNSSSEIGLLITCYECVISFSSFCRCWWPIRQIKYAYIFTWHELSFNTHVNLDYFFKVTVRSTLSFFFLDRALNYSPELFCGVKGKDSIFCKYLIDEDLVCTESFG